MGEPAEVADENLDDNVPSDQDNPREPPRAPTTVPMMLKDGQKGSALAQRTPLLKKINLGKLKNSADSNSLVSDEEAEWLKRQRISGVIGRMVQYGERDSPVEDILGLRCSRHGRIIVTAVRE